MARRGVLSIDATCVTLVWVPVVVLCTGVVVGLPGAWLLSITGLSAAACTWVYAVWIARPRQRWLSDLEEVADELWRASGADRQPVDAALNRAARVTRSLQGVRGPVVSRLSAALTDLSTLRAVFDAAPSPTLATDGRGVVIACNRAVEELTDRAASSVLGRSIDRVFTQADVLRLHDAGLRGESRMGEVRMVRGGVPRVYQVLCAPVGLGGAGPDGTPTRPGVIVSMRDVTELAQAVHLKTDFVANASHELRTPLSTIRLSAETLDDGAWEDGTMRERLLRVIRTNVQRLEELVNDLLDLSRLETPEAPVTVEDFSLQSTCNSLMTDFQEVVRERGLSLEFDIHPGAAVFRTDRKLLTLILKNLVDNATKFAHPGTTVRVTAEPTHGVGGMPAGARLRVIDAGLGIPLDQQARIFERFYQVDASRTGFTARRGTGLGLAIVKHAVKSLGGAVRVESVWQQGTTMIVDLPACIAPG